MKRQIILAIGLSMALGVGCDPSAQTKPPSTNARAGLAESPADFPAPQGTRLLVRASAKGDQIYTVKAGANGNPEWSAATPDAKLYDDRGKQIGTHGKGPHWTFADGGTVVGQLPAAKKTVPDPAAVPWLEINAKTGTASGGLKDVTVIQRVKTTGGLPPAAELSQANIGKEFRSPYTAEYLFYVPAK